MIPQIETERLILRAHQAADFDTYVEMWQDPAVYHFIGGQPFTREASWTRFVRHAGLWHHLGFGFFAVVEKATGNVVGEAGFFDMHRDMTPSIEGTLECGWALTPNVQGWGYATEAMTAAIAWADNAFPGRLMTCIIDPDNQPSLRVAARLGFKEFARTSYKDSPVIVFERRPPAK